MSEPKPYRRYGIPDPPNLKILIVLFALALLVYGGARIMRAVGVG